MRKLEIYYLSNRSENLYFCLLGDCTESDKKDEEFDKDIILHPAVFFEMRPFRSPASAAPAKNRTRSRRNGRNCLCPYL